LIAFPIDTGGLLRLSGCAIASDELTAHCVSHTPDGLAKPGALPSAEGSAEQADANSHGSVPFARRDPTTL
jgi:hypothetical protein